jgi:hypothetical protein
MSKKGLLLILSLFIVSAKAQAVPDAHYSSQNREQFLEKALIAFQNLESNFIHNTQQYLRSQNRYACSAQAEQLRIQCLIAQADVNCQASKKKYADSCVLVSDVIANNLIEERTFVDKVELVKIMNKLKGSDQVMTALNSRYSRLTSDFILSLHGQCASQDLHCLSVEINRYCLKRANEKTMAWQGCAGAIVWFIGSNFK